MILLISFAVLSIGASFLCSILEAALLSITPSYVASLEEKKPKLHKRLLALKQDIDRPLAAILTLNTIAHTVGATGVGAQVTVLYGEAWLGLASAVMTLLILILSEIIPKTIGATYWRQLAPAMVPLLRGLMWAMAPFIWMSEGLTKRIGGGEPKADLRDEIKALARFSEKDGALDRDEVRVITNILNLHEMPVTDIMTPRTVSVSVPPDMTAKAFEESHGASPFSRYPVIDENEHAVGYVHASDVLKADPVKPMSDLTHSLPVVGPEQSVEEVFTMLMAGREHMAVVYNELGTWLGVVTMEDVLETILGQEILDETDQVADLRLQAKLRWLRRNSGPRPPA